MPDGPELAAVQQAHHRRLLGIRETAADLVDDAWLAFAGLDDAAAAQFTAATVPIIEGVTAQTATLAAAYLSANDAILGHASEIVPEIPVLRGGRPIEDVYRRSIVEARRLVGNGVPAAQALDTGRARAVSTARTDVILANKAAIADAKRPWVVGYRRVLTGKSCALCATASTQRYRSAELQPIHPSCDCDVAEIYGTADPGRIVNRQLLEQLQEAGKADGRPDYWNGPYMVDEDGAIRYAKREVVRDADGAALRTPAGAPVRVSAPGDLVRSQVRQHGELGPTLTDKRHDFTPPAKVAPTPPPAPPRGRPITADDVSVEARRRGLDPVKLAARRESKRLARLEEQASARAAARELTPDHPDVIRVAERHGVSPSEVIAARVRVADMRKVIREEAARVEAEAFDEIYRWNVGPMRGPSAVRDKGGEYDWMITLDEREKARLSRKWFSSSPDASTPDQLVQEMASVDERYRGASVDEGVRAWLDANRRMEAAGALRRGKLPSSRAYSGQIDVDNLLPGVADEGYSIETILQGQDLDAAAHIASVDRDLVAGEALQYLGRSANAQHGPSPYRMSYQAWEEEVRDLEYLAREVPREMTDLERARLGELVPEYLDEPGTSYEDLYARIVTTAEQAGEEVPAYARIPWE